MIIHNTKELNFIAQVFRNISTTLDINGLSNVSFMIIGHQDGIQKFFDRDSSARSSFDSILLEAMSDTEVEELLKKGFKQVGVGYESSFLTRRCRDIGGYPYSIQALGHNLVDIDEDNYIDRKDWEEAISKTFKE